VFGETQTELGEVRMPKLIELLRLTKVKPKDEIIAYVNSIPDGSDQMYKLLIMLRFSQSPIWKALPYVLGVSFGAVGVLISTLS
jgi:hypothetical protein